MTRLISALLTAFLVTPAASAEVVRIVVDSRVDIVAGTAYGLAGPYEKLAGMVYFEVDPENPANQIITDVALAPRNARGKVEFHSNFFLL